MIKIIPVFIFFVALFSSCGTNPAMPAPDPTPYATPPSFAAVPGGTYIKSDGSGSFSHTITSFQISRHEITYEQWYLVRRWALSNGYVFSNAGLEGFTGTPATLEEYYALIAKIGAAPSYNRRHPVTTVSWRDAVVWCNAFSVMDGLEPVYCGDAGHTTPVKNTARPGFEGAVDTSGGSADNPYVNWAATGYRLPTLGEWQYAARYIEGVTWTPIDNASGASAAYTDLTATAAVAWFNYNSGGITHETGTKTPNALGIFDMSGNVWEYLWDWENSTSYYPQTDYHGPIGGSYHIAAGGSVNDTGYMLQLRPISSMPPYSFNINNGFRIVKK